MDVFEIICCELTLYIIVLLDCGITKMTYDKAKNNYSVSISTKVEF